MSRASSCPGGVPADELRISIQMHPLVGLSLESLWPRVAVMQEKERERQRVPGRSPAIMTDALGTDREGVPPLVELDI